MARRDLQYHPSDDSSDGESSVATSSSSDDDDDDSHKGIRLPVLKYGYRTEPLAWDEIVAILTVSDPDLARMSRSVEQQREYEVYRRDLLRTWNSVLDHVLCSKFPALFVPQKNKKKKSKTANSNAQDGNADHDDDPDDLEDRWVAHPSLSEIGALGIAETVLVRNDFPYYMEDGIEHWVLWKVGGSCTDAEIEGAKMELSTRRDFGENNVLHWTNPPHLKSLPEIDHVHFLGRRQHHNDDDTQQPPQQDTKE
jgi:Protein of unknown function (DUF3605)